VALADRAKRAGQLGPVPVAYDFAGALAGCELRAGLLRLVRLSAFFGGVPFLALLPECDSRVAPLVSVALAAWVGNGAQKKAAVRRRIPTN
jgi:hypothetical protein